MVQFFLVPIVLSLLLNLLKNLNPMSEISDKMNVATSDASPMHQHPAIFSNHFTSQCFMRPAPIVALETIPKRKTTLKVESFARFQAMPKPVFGRANVYNRCFFVPFRTVFRHFNSFIESSPSSTALGTTNVLANVPCISNLELLQLLFYSESSNYYFVYKLTDQSSSAYDFDLKDTTTPTIGDSGKFRLNDQGVFLYKVLRSLGYNIIADASYVKQRSALPLLSYIKVFLDWYHPSAFAFNTIYSYFEEFFENATSSSRLTIANLAYFFTGLCYCSYNQDYFTSSWTNPVGPNASSFEGLFQIPDLSNDAGTYQIVANDPSLVQRPGPSYVPSNGTPFVGSNGSSSSSSTNTYIHGSLTQYVVDALRSLTDYTVRHRLAGVRAVDRYLAEYGVNLSSEIAKRSIYLGYDEFPCQFGDNMSQSDTYVNSGKPTGARLGDYSGKGIAYDRGTFTIDGFSEIGMILVINSVVPQTGYYQGYDRHIDHIYPLDFYKGDFDHLGVQAIPLSELLIMPDGANTINTYADRVFGFVPRYAEYHVYNDHVTGLPSLNSIADTYDCMYLNRDVAPIIRQMGSTPSQSLEFVLAQDYMQFNRICYKFGDTENGYSDFIDFIHHITIDNVDTSKDLFDVYDFEKNVNKVRMSVNGTNLQ